MKKSILFAFLILFSLDATNAFASNSDTNSKSVNPAPSKENRLSKDDINRLSKRFDEISNLDKANLTHKQKHELKKEIKSNMHKAKKDVYVITGSTLLIIILICLCL